MLFSSVQFYNLSMKLFPKHKSYICMIIQINVIYTMPLFAEASTVADIPPNE